MHSCLFGKNPCLSEASLDFFDDILKAENSFSNETGRQATAPDRLVMPVGMDLIRLVLTGLASRRKLGTFPIGEGLNRPDGVSIRGHQIALALSEHKHRAERT